MSSVREIIVADIGGTHARFALAQISEGQILSLDHLVKMEAREHASLQIAWEAYGAELGRDLPNEGAIAVAAALDDDVMYFTNSSWILRPALVGERLGLERFKIINDFGAVAYAVANLGPEHFAHVCGPDKPFENNTNVSVLGPGTGLGVAQLVRWGDDYQVIETEGGHIDFAPLDPTEDRLLEQLREEHRRVSVERVASGPGLRTIYRLICELEGQTPQELADRDLWALALGGQDALATAACDRFCLCLGAAAGDLALAHGSSTVVLAGGLGARMGDRLTLSGFKERFVAKGRFQSRLEAIPVYRLIHSEPGLFGAASAFVKEFGG